jgi:hypothetical protein
MFSNNETRERDRDYRSKTPPPDSPNAPKNDKKNTRAKSRNNRNKNNEQDKSDGSVGSVGSVGTEKKKPFGPKKGQTTMNDDGDDGNTDIGDRFIFQANPNTPFYNPLNPSQIVQGSFKDSKTWTNRGALKSNYIRPGSKNSTGYSFSYQLVHTKIKPNANVLSKSAVAAIEQWKNKQLLQFRLNNPRISDADHPFLTYKDFVTFETMLPPRQIEHIYQSLLHSCIYFSQNVVKDSVERRLVDKANQLLLRAKIAEKNSINYSDYGIIERFGRVNNTKKNNNDGVDENGQNNSNNNDKKNDNDLNDRKK